MLPLHSVVDVYGILHVYVYFYVYAFQQMCGHMCGAVSLYVFGCDPSTARSTLNL